MQTVIEEGHNHTVDPASMHTEVSHLRLHLRCLLLAGLLGLLLLGKLVIQAALLLLFRSYFLLHLEHLE